MDKDLNNLVYQVRRDILRMVHQVNSGHPGGSLGCTEFFIVMFNKILNFNLPFSKDGINEDVFLLSNGHISPVYYSILSRIGFFELNELKTFRKINSRLQGHPTNHDNLPGIRISSGSLGQGLSVSIGAALSKKLNNDKSLVYVLTGDGELQEGQNWEAFMFASANKIDNLIAVIDLNGQQIDGSTSDVLDIGNLNDKLCSFGWEVIEIEEGNNMEEIFKTLTKAKESTRKRKPVAVLMKTIMGNGVDFMMHTHEWHGIAPNDEQLEIALSQNAETIGDY
ncbi:MAG TPA: transketolase [Flavobacteriaceae bacterium]|jgi:transketolase|nr:transketolase [Flavobacteriaceae bacterium]MDP7183405.1 transketolase [Flavobacteriaceae bacterium]HJO70795.1 transketolase [Flavobacteriaceae bacterium]|tara:strand:- start:4007 stop:4846 length:840 start_codon:yes stop_codon:yes gene_type:complete